jgi:hypothetical protein
MSGTTITRSEVANAERWRQWQLDYEASSRRGARRARTRTVITLILTALGAWVCLQLLSLQFWA